MTILIPNALAILRRALYAGLSPLCPTFQSRAACYWKIAAPGVASALLDGTLASCIVYQSQDGGGRGLDSIGMQDWQGDVTIRCMSRSLATAEALLATIPNPLVLSATGYSLHTRHLRPIDIPNADGIQVAASLYRITITTP